MTELIFPLFGATIVFSVVVPPLTVAARLLLAAAPDRKCCIDRHGSSLRYMLIVGPTIGPVLWLVSAAAHQSEEGAPLAVCIAPYFGVEFCRDVVLFALVLSAVPLAGVGYGISSFRGPNIHKPVSKSSAVVDRVRRVCARHPALAPIARRVCVVDRNFAPVCTSGVLHPVVEIAADVADQLSDEEIEAALLHELEHTRARDPLRLLVARLALSINPLGRILEAEFERYWFAREAICDRRAVQLGADPLSLASGIVAVARTGSARARAEALSGHGMDGIRVRIHLLLDSANRRPAPPRRFASVGFLTLVTPLLIVLPHVSGTGPLDVLHYGVESCASLVGII
ncbi:MAG: hypothetical protein CME06_14480 [Gemmatimonadetes bacterium]|nr:hypothetical protein [Gemmatimonadota bacterium]